MADGAAAAAPASRGGRAAQPPMKARAAQASAPIHIFCLCDTEGEFSRFAAPCQEKTGFLHASATVTRARIHATMQEEVAGMSKWILAAIALFALATAAVYAADSSQMSVTVKETKVRATPSALGKIVGVLVYGDRVTIVDESKGWKKISMPEKKIQGWVSLSALTEKEIVLNSGSENVAQGASSNEVALAGKGFNEDVEKQYKSEGNLDYTWVDKMLEYDPSSDQVTAFLQKGGLNATGGTE
jgi:hypothetical protein